MLTVHPCSKACRGSACRGREQAKGETPSASVSPDGTDQRRGRSTAGHLGVASKNKGPKVEARACRLVTMPEWQGAGVGFRFLNAICEMQVRGDPDAVIRAANIKVQ